MARKLAVGCRFHKLYMAVTFPILRVCARLHGAGRGAFSDNIAPGWLTSGGPCLRTQTEDVGIAGCSRHSGLYINLSSASSSAKPLGHGRHSQKTRCVRSRQCTGVASDGNPQHGYRRRNPKPSRHGRIQLNTEDESTGLHTTNMLHTGYSSPYVLQTTTRTLHRIDGSLHKTTKTTTETVPSEADRRLSSATSCPHNGLDDGSLCRECAETYCMLHNTTETKRVSVLAVCLERVKMSLNCRNALLPFLYLFLINLLNFAQCLRISVFHRFLLQRHGRLSTRWAIRNLIFTFNLVSLLTFASCSAVMAVASSDTGARSDLDPGKSGGITPFPDNPLLRSPRNNKFDDKSNMCHIWTRHTPRDLCERGLWARLKYLRDISLFSKDCDIEDDNIQLGQFLRLEWKLLKSANDLVTHSEHLKDGVQGRSCLLGAINSDECLKCFDRIDKGLQLVDQAYQAFAKILKRFDCLLAVDSDSATRPFSPNGTCSDCKRWYRKWALVQLIQVWKDPPCINWCYYAQLACPHLATNRVVDFGGHPAFLCRDLDIPQSQSGHEEVMNRDGVSSCSCVHPCDLETSASGTSALSAHGAEKSFDFFADPEHCRQRLERCETANRKSAMFSTLDRDDPAVTGTKKRKKRRRRHNDDEATTSRESPSPALSWLAVLGAGIFLRN
ncbi:unnamed protein product [Bursaphelenchus okinawaensis]|uniref:Uncharacterized protein n=1 Tax=Bursaphelenchus okinawaensis TaxID=465554 RepID=A0A811LN37_9BILA|nr:unnamed protein product [Bursaphelenchus okinawaensis]CAG9125908.1 unnamed protein product [Bursaphelenchus okinawaensis]